MKVYHGQAIRRFILWQAQSLYCDWLFSGQDFALRTVSMETVQPVYFFVLERMEAGKFKICNQNSKKKTVNIATLHSVTS